MILHKVSSGPLLSTDIYYIVSNDSDSVHGMSWSDCADAQGDLGLLWPQMSGDMFLHGAAHLNNIRTEKPLYTYVTANSF